MIYNRIILFDTDIWEVYEFPSEWRLVKPWVSITFPKPDLSDTYDRFTDRLLKLAST